MYPHQLEAPFEAATKAAWEPSSGNKIHRAPCMLETAEPDLSGEKSTGERCFLKVNVFIHSMAFLSYVKFMSFYVLLSFQSSALKTVAVA